MTENRMLQEGDACRVRADRHSGAIVQVVGLPHKRRPNRHPPTSHRIGIWELATGRLVHMLAGTGRLDIETLERFHLLFSPDGHLLISPSYGLSAWQVETWQKLSGAEGIRMASGHSALTASGDGKLLAFCDHEEVEVWGVPLATAESGLLAKRQRAVDPLPFVDSYWDSGRDRARSAGCGSAIKGATRDARSSDPG